MKTLKTLLAGAAASTALCLPLAHGADAMPIVRAAGAGQTAAVVALLDQGVSPDAHEADGLTPLMAAAANGHFETVQALMIHGARKELADAGGRTAYDYAMEKQAIDIIGLLRDGS